MEWFTGLCYWIPPQISFAVFRSAHETETTVCLEAMVRNVVITFIILEINIT